MPWRVHPDSAIGPKGVMRTPESGNPVLTDTAGLTLFSSPITAAGADTGRQRPAGPSR